MQVRPLGPVDVVVDGESRLVHGLRRKAVLAALALHHGEVVSTGQLVDAVWGAAAPATAAATPIRIGVPDGVAEPVRGEVPVRVTRPHAAP